MRHHNIVAQAQSQPSTGTGGFGGDEGLEDLCSEISDHVPPPGPLEEGERFIKLHAVPLLEGDKGGGFISHNSQSIFQSHILPN